MPISEAERADLYTGFVEVFGPARAEIMMSAYKSHDLDEVATKRDLAELRVEMANLRSEFKSDLTRQSLILAGGFLGVIATLIGVGLLS